ncbi:MAG: peptidyl-prolyl cis-trans isomerase [Pseudomonadota bacterium]
MLREPLVHFLVAGLFLFLAFNWLRGESSGEDLIVVDEASLAEMIAYRNPRLAGSAALTYLGTLDEESRSQLVEDFVRDEVLYREALAMGLNQSNYLAKRRLIAQLEYLYQGIAYDALELTEEDISSFYAEHSDRYRVPEQRTFTHVFFSMDGREDASFVAEQELKWLNEVSLPFHQSAGRGDHFLYHRNYVNKSLEEVAAHFGNAFAEATFALNEDTQWQGPIRSAYGEHLVLVASLKEEYLASLAEVKARVADDLARDRMQHALDAFYETAREGYRVVLSETDKP